MDWDGAPVDHKRKWNRVGPEKKKKGDDQISVMGSQKMKIHNWMISEREVKE
jgi:hypothetical protein